MKYILAPLFLLSLTLSPLFAQDDFYIHFKSEKEGLSFHKWQSRLKVQKAKKLCKELFPKKQGKWNCIDTNEGIQHCALKYSCIDSTKKLDRKRYARLIKKKLTKIEKAETKIKLKVSKSFPLKKVEKKKTTSFFNQLKNLDSSLANASAAYSQISDSLGSSVGTFNYSWTPHFWSKNDWGLRGQAGFQMMQTTEAGETEQFLILEFGGFGIYKFNQFFAEAGLGLQKWNNNAGDSATFIALGGGYFFKEKILSYIDRVSVNYLSVGNETSNTELRIGIGASF